MIPADAELTPRHDEIPAWDDMPDDLKPVLRRQMEVYAGFLEFTDHHVGPAVRRARGSRGVRGHARLLHHRRQRRLGRRHAERHVQRDDQLQRRGRAGDAGVHDRTPRRSSAGRTPTTTTRSAGRTRWTRRTSGPSRSPRTSAARATARSCTGRPGSRRRARSATQFSHVIDVAPTVLDAAGLIEPKFVNGVQQTPMQGVSMRYAFDDAAGRGAPRDPVLRDVRQPRHLPQGLDRRDAPQDAVAARRRRGPRVRRRRLGALRHQRRLDAVRGRLRAASRQAARAPAAVRDRGDPQQRPAARRPRRRAAQPGPRRPADAHQGQPAAAVRRHGPPDRELGRQHQEQVALRDGRDRRAVERRAWRAGRDHRPGRQHRRLEPVRARTAGCGIATTCSASSGSTSTATARSRPAPTRCGWSSTTTAPGSARAAPRRCSSTASRSDKAPSPRPPR